MCGIYGWSFVKSAGISDAKRGAMAASLGILNEERGRESWGAYVYDGSTPSVRRLALGASEVTGHAELGSRRLVFGHTRQSTHGKVDVANCHPFKAGKILLAHNGVISNHEELNKDHKRDCTCDSMHLAHHLNEGKDFKEIRGYGSIEWVEDDKPGVVYLCRMRSGSLSVAMLYHKGVQVGSAWSSDKEHLRTALCIAGIDYKFYDTPVEGQVHYIDPKDGILYYEPGRLLTLGEPKYDAAKWVTSMGGSKYSSVPGYNVGGSKSVYSDHADSFGDDDYAEFWKARLLAEEEDTGIVKSSAAHTLRLVDEPATGAHAANDLRLKRREMARRFDLTLIDTDLWVDGAGEPVNAEDLDQLIMDEAILDLGAN